MNIRARIRARKILLAYFYEQYFFDIAGKHESILEDIDEVSATILHHDDESIDLSKQLSSSYYKDTDIEIWYIAKHFFWKYDYTTIDRDYLTTVWPHYARYKDTVVDLVDSHIVSFAYHEMDIIDRVIFLLWYIEYKELHTPKEVLLNEMIELSKRYWDHNSSKLINWIWHKILHN